MQISNTLLVVIFAAILTICAIIIHISWKKLNSHGRVGKNWERRDYIEAAKKRTKHQTPFPEEDKSIKWDQAENFMLKRGWIKEIVPLDERLPEKVVARNSLGILFLLFIFVPLGLLMLHFLRTESFTLRYQVAVVIVALGSLVASCYILYLASDRRPKVIISEQGIETDETPFYSWSQISNENYYATGIDFVKKQSYFLVYDHPGGRTYQNVHIQDVPIDKLAIALRTYRNRYEKRRW